MFDAPKIISGLVIFLILITTPFWYRYLTCKDKSYPAPTEVAKGEQCVMSADYMRSHHMNLLEEWRDDVVRKGDRMFKSPDGRFFKKSLSNTCLDCHQKETNFCSKCHDYTGV